MTKPMTPERLKAIKDRHEALTKGTYPMRFYPLLSKDLPDCTAEIERLQAREDEWANLLKSANNDVERLNEYINTLQGE